MSQALTPDWDPQSAEVQENQRATYDHLRDRCPVAYSQLQGWTVFRHGDVKHILSNHDLFSNQVSKHISVPNGMDLPQHTAYRELIEPYFSAESVAAFKPVCQTIADELAYQSLNSTQAELMADFAEPMAARLQCAFMGWPQELAAQLLDWQKRNSQAVFAADRTVLSALAQEFENLIAAQLEVRRKATSYTNDDVTRRLLHEKVNGKALSDEEIASILRNWTVGEVGTIAASIGIIAQFLASNPEVQAQIRQQPELLWQANDEILRLHNPLTDNRRRTTCPVTLSGQKIGENERVVINWVAANRDSEAFERADEFILDRNQSDNLLYGAGLHVCPGEGLAKMELVVIMRAVLQHTEHLDLIANKKAEYARYPASGYAVLPLSLR